MARAKQRETYGNGSIVPIVDADGNQKRDKRGNPIWRVCVSFGYTEHVDENGRKSRRQDKRQRNFHGTLKDARKFSQQLIKEHEEAEEERRAGIDREQTFAELCRVWEDEMRFGKVCNAYKLKSYSTHLSYMCAHFGDKPVAEVTPDDVRAALRSVVRTRRLSDTTANAIFAVTKRVFTYARKKGKIHVNPCEDMKAPRPSEAVDRHSLTANECALIRATLDRDEEAAYEAFRGKEQRQREYDPFKGSTDERDSLRGLVEISNILAVRLMLATGMRRGEVLGLTWSAVNFATKQIKVVQALAVQKLDANADDFDAEEERIEVRRSRSGKSSLVIKRPKTKRGIRTLYVDDDTLAHLREWKKFQARALKLIRVDEDGNAISVKQTQATPVFCSSCGSWEDPSNLNRWWAGTATTDGYRDRIGFPDLKMHEFRHTQATMLLGNGVDVKTVQARLGHARSSHTLDLYAHAIPANDQAAANLMASICSQPATPVGTILEIPRSA